MSKLLAHLLLPCWLVASAHLLPTSNELVPRAKVNPTGQHVCEAPDAPPNPKIRCAYEGLLKKAPTPITSLNSTSYEDCRNQCLVNGNGAHHCVSFSYQASKQHCALYDVAVRSQKPRKHPSGVKFWNRACFAPTFYNDSAIINPGFETGILSPWTTQPSPNPANTISIVSPGHNSAYAVQFDMSRVETGAGGSSSDGENIVQRFTICKDVAYELTYSLYQVPNSTVSNDDFDAFLSLFARDSENNPIDGGTWFLKPGYFEYASNEGSPHIPEGTWKTYTVPFTAQASGEMYTSWSVIVTNTSKTKFLLDDVQVSTV